MGREIESASTSEEDPPFVEALVEAPPKRRSLEHWLVLCVPLAGLALIAVFAFLVEPDARGFGTHERLGLPSCKSMDWFGVPCPGCGVTTSVALASRGRFLDSMRNQPFGLVVVLGILAGSIWALRGHFLDRNLYSDLVAIRVRPWAIGLGTVLAICWIYKLALVFGAFPWSPPR
jgi:hypothetical protein